MDQLVYEKFAEFLRTVVRPLSNEVNDGLVQESNVDEHADRQTVFQSAAQQVLKKNEELYQRLAK